MERVAVDVMGPLPRTNKGNVYILSVIDYFTKWPEAYALPNQEAETVADALLGSILSRFGMPDTLHSDQGRHFESQVSLPCAAAREYKRQAPPSYVLKVTGSWRGFNAHWVSSWPY